MYPLGEKEVVVGFEAVVSGRLVSVELQSRGKLEDCCLDCCPGLALHTQCGHSKEWGCCGGTGIQVFERFVYIFFHLRSSVAG